MTEPAFFSLEDDKIRAFATHMAQEIMNFEGVCKVCNITEAEGNVLKTNPTYLKYYEKELMRFNSPETAGDKLRRHMDELALFIMPAIVTMVHDPDTSDTAKANLVGTIMKHSSVGGTGAGNKGGSEGGGVVINIKIADQTFSKEAIVIEPEKLEAVT